MSVDGAKPLNQIVLSIALPALVLDRMHALRVERELLIAALAPWLVFAVGALVLLSLLRRGRLSRATAGALVLTAALGNTSFVGLPMIEAYYGRAWQGVGVVADQLGTFLCLSLPGLVVAMRLAGRGDERPTAAETAKRIVLFPPFLALVAAVALRPVAYPEAIETLLSRLGDLLAPLALLSVGLQLRVAGLARHLRALGLGLAYKLVAAPLLVFALFGVLLGARGPVLQVTVFEAAMAPMITGSIVAQELDLDRELAVAMVGVGIPISFATLWLWFHLLAGFG